MERKEASVSSALMRSAGVLWFLIILAPATLSGTDLHPGSYYARSIYQSYINGEITTWGSIIREMDEDYTRSRDPKLLKQIIFANYGYIGYHIGAGNEKEAMDHLEKTISYLDALLEEGNDTPSWVYTMYSASQGFRLSFNPLMAPFIGPSVIANIKKAIEADSLEPMGWIEMGNSYYYRPTMFGGSADKALQHYLRAMGLFEQQGEAIENSWIYLNLFVQVAQCYIDLNTYDKAMAIYEEVLLIEPGFSWVRDELKPELDLLMEGMSGR